ncbi:hypothetical protein [uncultured Tenacibaculum sp.]|uniref:hypothetical protein n=1 Tax=uncultured Tenacibaculum sp. TaxID=174713 RepID=UPI0026326A8B|nr:hypothetical protein [uncultured Tenacibaculum sp.]
MLYLLNAIIIFMLFDVISVSITYLLSSYYNINVEEIRLWCNSEKRALVNFKLKYPIYIGLNPIATGVKYKSKPDEFDENFEEEKSDFIYFEDLRFRDRSFIALTNSLIYLVVFFIYFSYRIDMPREGLGSILELSLIIAVVTILALKFSLWLKKIKLSVIESYVVSKILYIFLLLGVLVIIDKNYIPFYTQIENLFAWKYYIKDFINNPSLAKSVEVAFWARFLIYLPSLFPTPFGIGKYFAMIIYLLFTGKYYKEKKDYGFEILIYPIIIYGAYIWILLGLFFTL